MCVASATIAQSVNLTRTALTPGRTCGEAPQLVVTALPDPMHATISSTPTSGCFSSTDELLLINLQGTPSAHDNVGNWELLELDHVAGTTVSFRSPKTRFYGAAGGSDDGIGVGAAGQKVALVRVPDFGMLTIAPSAAVTADPWDGSTGGVVALRAAKLVVSGTIDGRALGYRSGRWSQDGTCFSNLATEAGESISGPGTATISRNVGGPGGLSAVSGISFNGDTPMCATAGHATTGVPGRNPNGRIIGDPGTTYGVPDGTGLTMGSGPSGNVTCDGVQPAPRYIVEDARAGGIVLILGGDITVTSTGAISATPIVFERDVAASGGYVMLRGRDLDVGRSRVQAVGGVALGGSPATMGMSIAGGDGYVVLEGSGTITGTTSPPARVTHL
jgi:hypothetical protein